MPAAVLADRRRVIVVPHRGLSLLPWHLLPWDGDLLGGTRVISVLPAAGLLTTLAARPAVALDRGALVVGNPAFAHDRDLAPLDGTDTEARAVAAVLPHAICLLGDAATRAAVLTHAAGRSVLHLATHGLLDSRWPHLTRLALAGQDALSMGDLMAAALGCDLVVLSACRTGQGQATAGGDVVGLARAALVAGVPNLVVSLWPLDDQAGCLMAVDLAQRVAVGEPVADAVHAVRLAARALDGAARESAYTARQAATGGPAPAPGARDLDPLQPTERGGPAGDPYFWGPFVHIGA